MPPGFLSFLLDRQRQLAGSAADRAAWLFKMTDVSRYTPVDTGLRAGPAERSPSVAQMTHSLNFLQHIVHIGAKPKKCLTVRPTSRVGISL
jgi:hypothetical protein